MPCVVERDNEPVFVSGDANLLPATNDLVIRSPGHQWPKNECFANDKLDAGWECCLSGANCA
jgi:hypothetical protein